MDKVILAQWAWLYVAAWFVFLAVALWSIKKPSLTTLYSFLLAFILFISTNVIYAIVTEQYAFLVLPVVLVAFSISINKAAQNASNDS